ncbi:1381_t:CDS:2, partial [Dentiscutata erythropus]
FETVNEILRSNKNGIHSLGICSNHFNYDNKQLHSCQKSEVSIDNALISRKKCLFCGFDKYIFSRGYCSEHSWKLCDRNIRIACNGLKVCPVFQSNDYVKQSTGIRRTRYICVSCFMSEGGHLYEQRGRGAVLPFDCTDQHCDDSTKSLQFLTKWINDISESAEKNTRCLLLDEIFRGIMAFFEKSKLAKLNEENISDEELEDDTIRNNENNINQKKKSNPLSFLGIKIAFRLKKVNIKKFSTSEAFCDTIKKYPIQMGEALANLFWRSRPEVRTNKVKLETPSSLKEYQDGFPSVFLIVMRKQKERGVLEKDYDDARAKKIALFFKAPPAYITVFNIMCAGVVAHTNRYEKHLEKQRRKQANIVEKLWVGEDVWNISHLTLRMVWQYRFPQAISSLIKSNNAEVLSFQIGRSTFIDQQIQNLEKIFHLFVEDK